MIIPSVPDMPEWYHVLVRFHDDGERPRAVNEAIGDMVAWLEGVRADQSDTTPEPDVVEPEPSSGMADGWRSRRTMLDDVIRMTLGDERFSTIEMCEMAEYLRSGKVPEVPARYFVPPSDAM